MYRLVLTRNSSAGNWMVVYLARAGRWGIYEYQASEIDAVDLKHSINPALLDIGPQFYTDLYRKLTAVWNLGSIRIRPIEYWIHIYVRYGVATHLSFTAYYKKVLELYSTIKVNTTMDKYSIQYSSKWQRLVI